MKRFSHSIACCALLVAYSCLVSDSFGAEQSQPAVLVDAAWVAENLALPDVRILEIGMAKDYQAGHLPRALLVDWIVDITDPTCPERYNIAPPDQFEQLMRRLGISSDTTIVLYDQFQSRLSTRMLWILRYYGHEQVKILDGGAQAWVTTGHEMVQAVPKVRPSQYRAGRSKVMRDAKRADIRGQLSQPYFQVIDGRPTKQYTGELPGKVYHTGKIHMRRGHITSGVNIPWEENLAADGRFKSVTELRKIYKDHAISKDATVVTYCNEGLHAAHPWFVLSELLGYEDVRVYDDSLSEWANLPDEPMEITAPPALSSQPKN